MKIDFSRKLLVWNKDHNTRSMPWKNEKDPYRIWLSEIILQQTRVEQGWTYYENFIQQFPSVHDLAKAPEKKVFKLWEGLGYYSRCRNLIATAKIISKEFKGEFPSTYETIAGLKGIGPYTAAAIASFAFNLPYPVLDGNVQRVLSRYFGISTPMDSSTNKKLYTILAASLLDNKAPGIYNQAIMDFGATICKPRNPLCGQCVQSAACEAFQHSWVSLLPVKKIKLPRKTRWFNYFIIETKDERVYIRKRNQKDIWEDLYEFVLWETGETEWLRSGTGPSWLAKLLGNQEFSINTIKATGKQELTHQRILTRIILVSVDKPISKLKDYDLIMKKDIHKFPFPRVLASHLQAL